MENLEKQCEDALFVVCDARERFSHRSAEELQKCIKFNKEINMMKVTSKASTSLNIIMGDQQKAILNNYTITDNDSYELLDNKFDIITHRLNNLKAVMEQIRQEKNVEMNKLLND